MQLVKKPKISKKSRFHQGFYKPINESKYKGNIKDIQYRSGLEFKFMQWCDFRPSIIEWGSESYQIVYFCPVRQSEHVYIVDFYIKYKTPEGRIEAALVEVKPHAETQPPTPGKRGFKGKLKTFSINQAKWKYASNYAAKRGMRFIVVTEQFFNKEN